MSRSMKSEAELWLTQEANSQKLGSPNSSNRLRAWSRMRRNCGLTSSSALRNIPIRRNTSVHLIDHVDSIRAEAKALRARSASLVATPAEVIAKPTQLLQQTTLLKKQAPETLFRLRLVEIGLPLALSIVSILLTLRYPLTEARCYEIKEALKKRHAGTSDLRVYFVLFARLPLDSRTTSSAGRRPSSASRSGSAIRWQSKSIAVAPMFDIGTRTVVSSGLVIWATRVSSKPTTAKILRHGDVLGDRAGDDSGRHLVVGREHARYSRRPNRGLYSPPIGRPTRTCSPNSKRRPCSTLRSALLERVAVGLVAGLRVDVRLATRRQR